jgi:hypothetical protein
VGQGLGLGLLLGGRLLGLETPDVGARLELGNVLGIFVALVASAGGLGSLRDRGTLVLLLLLLLMVLLRVILLLLVVMLLLLLLLLLLLSWALTGLVEHLLLLHGAGNLGRLTSKVKVLANALLGGGAIAKRVVIEGIVGVVERGA